MRWLSLIITIIITDPPVYFLVARPTLNDLTALSHLILVRPFCDRQTSRVSVYREANQALKPGSERRSWD